MVTGTKMGMDIRAWQFNSKQGCLWCTSELNVVLQATLYRRSTNEVEAQENVAFLPLANYCIPERVNVVSVNKVALPSLLS